MNSCTIRKCPLILKLCVYLNGNQLELTRKDPSNKLSLVLIVVRCRGSEVALRPSWTERGAPGQDTGPPVCVCVCVCVCVRAPRTPKTPLPLCFCHPLSGPRLQEINSSKVTVKLLQVQSEVCRRGNRQEVVLKRFPDGFLFIV